MCFGGKSLCSWKIQVVICKSRKLSKLGESKKVVIRNGLAFTQTTVAIVGQKKTNQNNPLAVKLLDNRLFIYQSFIEVNFKKR